MSGEPAAGPAIAAVIPAYDREATVGRAIASALAQSRPPAEVIVVDDGSTDATAQAVARFGDRVRCVGQANAGAAAARNRGVREATAEWIAFLDSDDYWLEDHLARTAAAIEATGGAADLYFSDMRRARDGGSESGRMLWELCGFAIDGPWELRADGGAWAMRPRQPMMLQSSVVRRSVYLELGGMRSDLLSRHDTHLFFLLCMGRPACAVAGCATEMTGDDRSGGRVTSAYGTKTLAYWEETDRLYEDLLDGAVALDAEQRRELSHRLAAAHLRLARLHWSERRAARAVAHVAAALRRSPTRWLEGLGRRLGSPASRRG